MAMRPGDDYDRDILDIIPERFDADADSHQARAGHRFRTIVTLVLAVVVVGAIVAAGWRFMGSRGNGGGAGIPVIKADERPIKTRPDDRGGMEVPNQDKLVYQRMEGEGEGKTERLLPPAEQPLVPPRAQAPEQPVPPVAAVPAPVRPAQGPTQAMISPPKLAEAPQPKAAAQPPVVRQLLAPPPAPAAAPVAATPAPAAAAPVQTAAVAPRKALPSGDWLVQLGAVRSADAADKEWARIQHTHAELLSPLKSDIVRVDLDKGTYWRVRAGPLSEQAARQLCQELVARNQGCILARK